MPNLEPGVGLPGEVTGPLPDLGNANLTVDENLQVDRVVVDNTGSTANGSGLLTADHADRLRPVRGDTIIGGVAFDGGVTYLEFEEVVLATRLGQRHASRSRAPTRAAPLSRATMATTPSTSSRSPVTPRSSAATAPTRSTSARSPMSPAAQSNLDSIDALLAIDGGAGADSVNVDQRGNTLGSTGTLTQTTLTGLEMASSLATVNDTVTLRVNATSGTYTLSYGSNTVTLDWNATANELTAALVNTAAENTTWSA